jgi:hypothetical protein
MYSQKNNYGSGVGTGTPFTGNDLRKATSVRPAYSGQDQSRSAFARALTDATKNETKNVFANADQEFRQKAEALRSRDVQSMRENRANRFGLQREKQVTMKKQDVGLQQNLADLEAYRIRGERDAKTQTIGNIAGLLTGMATSFLPGMGSMQNAWIREEGGGGGRSVFGMGLMRNR